MQALFPLLYQGLAGLVLITLACGFFRFFYPADYSERSALATVAVLCLLGVVNPAWGVWIKPWGSWALYAVLSVVGSVLMLSAAIWLQDFLRPPAAKTLGPEGMVFLLPVFPFVLTGIAAFVARLAIYR